MKDWTKTDLLREAYFFTLPLMMIRATATAMTNTLRPTVDKAPVNQLSHAQTLADADFTSVVTPNVDTIYSQMILDLSKDAVVLTMPKTERFCTVQLLDAYTNTVTVLDASSFETDRAQFLITGPGFDGAVPAGMTRIPYPTAMGWIIIRTICFHKADEANVHAIQGAMRSCTLAQYQAGTADQPPEGVYDEKNAIIPSRYVMQLPMTEYFAQANALMVANPPAQADAPMLEAIAAIGVGPGLTFDAAAFTDEDWMGVVSHVEAMTTRASLQFFTRNGCWLYMGAPIGEFGTEYAYRAFIAVFGLGANPVSVAVYPKTDVDSSGNRLHGSRKYVLHFDKDALPPVKGLGFWSVTAYNSENNFLIHNALNRYCINNRSDVVYNADGSLDVLIQTDRPADRQENWLPVLDGKFHLVLRIYLPADAVLRNTWPTPTITEVK